MKIKFIEKKHEASNAWTFWFEPPEAVNWQAGQYQRWELPINEAEKNDREHWFTISSAPFEAKFAITTRLSGSKFKSALDALKPGDLIDVDTREGDFTWQDTDQAKVFIAGGIGITPFHSIIKQRHHDGQTIDVHLLYAGRDEDFVFRRELEEIEKQHPELSISYLVGQLTLQSIKQDVPDILTKYVYQIGRAHV